MVYLQRCRANSLGTAPSAKSALSVLYQLVNLLALLIRYEAQGSVLYFCQTNWLPNDKSLCLSQITLYDTQHFRVIYLGLIMRNLAVHTRCLLRAHFMRHVGPNNTFRGGGGAEWSTTAAVLPVDRIYCSAVLVLWVFASSQVYDTYRSCVMAKTSL